MTDPILFPIVARREATFPVGMPIGFDVILPDGRAGQVNGFLDRKDALIRDVVVRLPCGGTVRAPMAWVRAAARPPLSIIQGGCS
jgi:hypothetical protein